MLAENLIRSKTCRFGRITLLGYLGWPAGSLSGRLFRPGQWASLRAADILNGMITAMTEVGKLFEDGEDFVPEMLISARAMQAGLARVHSLQRVFDTAGRGHRASGCWRLSFIRSRDGRLRFKT